MTTKQYNEEFFPKYNSAHCLISQLDSIIAYLGEDANKQFQPLGWSEELKQFMLNALEAYRTAARAEIERININDK